ncbi:MAG: NAD(+)/NADH kinase [Acidobacteriota bacterium]
MSTAPRIRSVGLVVRYEKPNALRTAMELTDWLDRKGIEVAIDTETQARCDIDRPVFHDDESYDLIIVLGGDGTLMSVARSSRSGIPILGVNLGTLGFLTELPRHNLYPYLARVLNGHYVVEERPLFEVAVFRGAETLADLRAFNDAVISKNALARIITLTVTVDARTVARVRADGLIISTPSGSTAYNLSAGGPIVDPQLQVAVITPICAHTLSLRPIVVPDNGSIEISVDTSDEEVFLSVDGQEGCQLGAGDRVRIRRSVRRVNLVRITGATFYDSLREKLNWGG